MGKKGRVAAMVHSNDFSADFSAVPPWQIVAANRWPIPYAVPSTTLTVPHFGSSPSTSLPVKYCSLISDNASK